MPARLPIGQIIRFHSTLNPRLWRNHELRVEVRMKLLQAAIAFYRFLDLPGLRVKDIIMTGSNAAYNYTRLSDIDVHLVVDYAHTHCPSLADNFFSTKKSLWNQTYDIVVRDHPVELYVEDTAEPVKANGVYSVLHNRWLKTPTDTPPARDDSAVEHKAQAYADEIDSLLAGEPDMAAINQLLSRLYALRQNGLMAGGEFSVENLAFKVLRNAGYLDQLRNARVQRRDRELSMR
jgi:hypothetical protein